MKTQRKRWFLYSEKELLNHIDVHLSLRGEQDLIVFPYDQELFYCLGHNGDRLKELILKYYNSPSLSHNESLNTIQMLAQGVALGTFDCNLEEKMEEKDIDPEYFSFKRGSLINIKYGSQKVHEYFPPIVPFLPFDLGYNILTMKNIPQIRERMLSQRQTIDEMVQHSREHNLGTQFYIDENKAA